MGAGDDHHSPSDHASTSVFQLGLAISPPSSNTYHFGSSSSLSWHSSPLPTHNSTSSEEPLDLRVDGKCRDTNMPEVNAAFRLFCDLMQANAVYGSLIEGYKEGTVNREVSSDEVSDASDDMQSTTCSEIGKKAGGGGGGGGGGKAARIHYHPEEPGSRETVEEMLRGKDPALRYINDGEAVVNPFAVDRKKQLTDLMRMFCREKAEGGYECIACGRERQLLREMQQHLLCHSDSKFYLCVRCLKGFNDTFDMKRHTRKHTMVRPYACPQCPSRFSQRCSLEGHLKRVHTMQLHFARHQRREVLRVCERCGFTCDHYAQLLTHTEQQHPTDQDAITRLRKRVIAAANRNGSSILHFP
uniref:Zinc finger protein n=2 Tax=Echinococcus granulosus TaxID=6210 RepID=A0A068WPX9_ECHGR|nr:zinc finger protein [Echinococcus granulosus]